MNKELISIIVPVYNAEPFLVECIESIINQTYKDIEIILIDDGSIDKSLDICKHYCEIDKRISFYNKSNGGASSARNFGIKKAKGSFIGFVDSDDYISEQMYEVLYRNMMATNCDVSMCGSIDYYSDDKQYVSSAGLKNKKYNQKELINKFLYREDNLCGATWDKLYKAEHLKDLCFLEGYIMEDYLFLAQLYNKIDSLYYDITPLYLYRHRHNSVTTMKVSSHTFDGIEISKMICSLFSNRNDNYSKACIFFETQMYYDLIIKLLNSDTNFKEIEKYISILKDLYKKILLDINISLKKKITIASICLFPKQFIFFRKKFKGK